MLCVDGLLPTTPGALTLDTLKIWWKPVRVELADDLADVVVDMRGSFRGLGVWCRDRRTGSLGQILVQIDGRLLATFQAKLGERADEAVGDALPLLDQGHEVVTPTGPLHDETVLRHQDGIDVVEVELGAGRDFHQGALRRTGRRLPPRSSSNSARQSRRWRAARVRRSRTASPRTFTWALRAFRPVRGRTGPPREPSVGGRVLFSGCGLGESGELSGT